MHNQHGKASRTAMIQAATSVQRKHAKWQAMVGMYGTPVVRAKICKQFPFRQTQNLCGSWQQAVGGLASASNGEHNSFVQSDTAACEGSFQPEATMLSQG